SRQPRRAQIPPSHVARTRPYEKLRRLGRRTSPRPTQPAKSVTTASHVTLGFRVHSGWAAVVALLDSPPLPEVIKRWRIELVEPSAPGGVQPYHAARNLDSRDAEKFIARVLEAVDRAALKAIDALNEDLGGQGKRVVA